MGSHHPSTESRLCGVPAIWSSHFTRWIWLILFSRWKWGEEPECETFVSFLNISTETKQRTYIKSKVCEVTGCWERPVQAASINSPSWTTTFWLWNWILLEITILTKQSLIHLNSPTSSQRTVLSVHQKLRLNPEAAINTSRPNEYSKYDSFTLEESRNIHSPGG